MTWFASPTDIESRVYARLPDTFRHARQTEWGAANKPGVAVDSFLEGPCLTPDGTLYVADIPYGRIFAVDPSHHWSLVHEYDGWPNGMKLSRDGSLTVADYKRGLLRVDPESGTIHAICTTVNSESFKGLNDLAILSDGSILFTDQGQTGMHDPTGRLYRLWPDGRLDRLVGNAASPNGVAVNPAGTHAYLALTRACQIWRLPLAPSALASKTQVFAQLPGGLSGPDGLVMDAAGRLIVCDPGHGCAWVLSPLGEPLFRVRSCAGRTLTNAVLRPDGRTLLMTESESGQILEAVLPE
ncbi:MAG: SMP-30/gluconolactonase/LRE family protein [Rhodoplanes sp.]|uniref:SMP-30/gluconolactonase/LRE family protein n=1 Tax=Rhodoplanes sp. TaxID=1968906 RepID=UPI00183AA3C9|nr:SMP-30/gluconolactonase/LRE family protein [Rhodoplanes sp.]NVO17082.1 SMP-30/gluconolactonase/LRE family protein [Rhodoplanes sp.]